VYGVIFFLPQQVASLIGAQVGLKVGLLAAVPWLCAVALTWIVPRRADRLGGHRGWTVGLLVLAGVGIAISGVAGRGAPGSPLVAMIGLCCAASGFIAAQPLFWTFPARHLTGAASASGIALINSLGGLGGFVAPMLRAGAEQTFSSRAAGLEILALASFAAALLVLIVVPRAGAGAAASFEPREPDAERAR
jgi:nitrate/nitrite transporter NarK